MQTMPLHPPGEYSQPTTNYTEITATTGAGMLRINYQFWVSIDTYWKMLILSADNSLFMQRHAAKVIMTKLLLLLWIRRTVLMFQTSYFVLVFQLIF